MMTRCRAPREGASMIRRWCLAAAVCLVTAHGAAAGPDDPVWQPPAFEATDTAGETFRYPEDLEGPTIVLFWATWCPFCGAFMPHLQSILDEYDGAVKLLALSFREDGDPQAFVADKGYEFRLFENGDPVAERWDVRGTPGFFLVDASGRVVFSRASIPRDDYPAGRFGDGESMSRSQIAARVAPFWAARMRRALDELMASRVSPGD